MTTNRAPRGQTTHLGYAQIAGGFHATRYATSRNRPMTHMVTINFSRLSIEEEAAGAVFSALRARVSRAWRYAAKADRGLGSFDYFHVHENPDNRSNVHWAVHLPTGYENWFERLIRDRLGKLSGGPCVSDEVRLTPVTTPGGMAKYMMKGANPSFAKHFHLTDWIADQGLVIGRRFGTSRSLGRSARKANWSRKGKITS